MANKRSGRVTLTLYRTTVEKLRDAKGGGAWDAFLLDLERRSKQGSRTVCIRCGKRLETEDIYKSPSALAKGNDWIEVGIQGEVEEGQGIGFICPQCLSRAVKKKRKK